MGNPKQFDLIISGSGSSAGGSFNNVRISGHGRVISDVECNHFAVSGFGSIEGGVKTKTGRISGQGEIKGLLKAEEFKVSGQATFLSNVEVDTAKFDGETMLKGGITSEQIENRGMLTVKGDCNSEVFISKGAFSIDGLLNAGRIEVSTYGLCRAKEIGGGNIKVVAGHSFSLMRLIKSIMPALDINDGLVADVIEGDEVYLEHTKAKVVRGNNVIIGKRCEIGLVEYKGYFEKDTNSIVMDSKKIG